MLVNNTYPQLLASVDPFIILFSGGRLPSEGLVYCTGRSGFNWSTSGPVCDGEGGLTEDTPIHDEGLWLGPSYTNELPSGAEDFQTGMTISGMSFTGDSNTGITFTRDSGTFGYSRHTIAEPTAPTRYTFSFDVKAGTTETIYVRVKGDSDGANNVYVLLNISTGVFSAASPEYTYDSYIVDNGYRRVTISRELFEEAQFYIGLGDRTGDTSVVGLNATFRNPMLIQGVGHYPYIPPGTTSASMAATSGGNGASVEMSTELLDCFRGSPMTAIVGVTMGVGSADIITPINITTVDDSVSGLVFLDIGGTIKCSDGTNTATVTITGGYSAFDEIYAVPQVSADGTQIRIGYVKNDDTSVTWGSYVTYSGTFTPGDYFRFAFENTTVMWSKGLGQYDIALDNTNILKVVKELK